jgi:hypothetical protein
MIRSAPPDAQGDLVAPDETSKGGTAGASTPTPATATAPRWRRPRLRLLRSARTGGPDSRPGSNRAGGSSGIHAVPCSVNTNAAWGGVPSPRVDEVPQRPWAHHVTSSRASSGPRVRPHVRHRAAAVVVTGMPRPSHVPDGLVVGGRRGRLARAGGAPGRRTPPVSPLLAHSISRTDASTSWSMIWAMPAAARRLARSRPATGCAPAGQRRSGRRQWHPAAGARARPREERRDGVGEDDLRHHAVGLPLRSRRSELGAVGVDPVVSS